MGLERVFTTGDLAYDYRYLLQDVVHHGRRVAPRGMEIKEITPLVLRLTNPTLPVVQRPGMSHALMWAEIAMVCAGVYDSDLYDLTASPATRSLLTEFGAYGPRTYNQLKSVIAELVRDPSSRRAVVYVGDRSDLELIHGGETDMPCTMTWQFFVRDEELEMLVNMRSWDLVWGLSYDVPVFTSVQRMVAAALQKRVGDYVHVAGSAHVYARHYELADTLQSARGEMLESPSELHLSRIRSGGHRFAGAAAAFDECQSCARSALSGFAIDGEVPEPWTTAALAWQKKKEKVLNS